MRATVIVRRTTRRLPEPTIAPDVRWTTAQCAEHLGVDERTVRDWRRLGLPYISIPGTSKILHRPESVLAWCDQYERRETPRRLRAVS